MYAELSSIFCRPAPFSIYTAEVLWTKAHLAQRMLETHLSQDTPLASFPINTIDQIVSWIDAKVPLSGKKLCDLGCGPGLYAQRFVQKGAFVTGMDFSANSIAYARAQTYDKGRVAYVLGNYLCDPFPLEQDVVTLIYCDLGVLSPDQRRMLYQNIRASLKSGGMFIFDVMTEKAFEGVVENQVFARNYMDGFWSAQDYFAFHNTYRYDNALSLDHFTIVEEQETWSVYNWFQYFTEKTITEELCQNGFEVLNYSEQFDGVSDVGEVAAIVARVKS